MEGQIPFIPWQELFNVYIVCLSLKFKTSIFANSRNSWIDLFIFPFSVKFLIISLTELR